MELPEPSHLGPVPKEEKVLGIGMRRFPTKKRRENASLRLFCCTYVQVHATQAVDNGVFTVFFLLSFPILFYLKRKKTLLFCSDFSPFWGKAEKIPKNWTGSFFYKRTFKCLQKHKAEIGPFFAKKWKGEGGNKKTFFWQLKEKRGKERMSNWPWIHFSMRRERNCCTTTRLIHLAPPTPLAAVGNGGGAKNIIIGSLYDFFGKTKIVVFLKKQAFKHEHKTSNIFLKV